LDFHTIRNSVAGGKGLVPKWDLVYSTSNIIDWTQSEDDVGSITCGCIFGEPARTESQENVGFECSPLDGGRTENHYYDCFYKGRRHFIGQATPDSYYYRYFTTSDPYLSKSHVLVPWMGHVGGGWKDKVKSVYPFYFMRITVR
jgi:hypothetical protein